MERRLAAILAADVQGYSHLTELNEEGSTATLRMYRAVVEESIAAHKGHIFSSAGDGVVSEFPSIIEAIRCAVEIQNEIAERNSSVPEKSTDAVPHRRQPRGRNRRRQQSLRHRCERCCSPRTTGGARRNFPLANRLRSGSEDRRDSIRGRRRAPAEEHC